MELGGDTHRRDDKDLRASEPTAGVRGREGGKRRRRRRRRRWGNPAPAPAPALCTDVYAKRNGGARRSQYAAGVRQVRRARVVTGSRAFLRSDGWLAGSVGGEGRVGGGKGGLFSGCSGGVRGV